MARSLRRYMPAGYPHQRRPAQSPSTLDLRSRVLWETLIRRSHPNLRNCVISPVLPRQSLVAVRDLPTLISFTPNLSFHA